MSWVVHKEHEPYDVYIGRPSEWGNPFSHKPSTHAQWRVESREEAIAKYREWLLAQPELVERVRRELRGKVLGCWCHPKACHGDVLAEIANEGTARSSTPVPAVQGQRCICVDTEYDARYTDRGVSRLSCMAYSTGPGHAELVGPARAVELWSRWVRDPEVTFIGHSFYNDAAVLADEAHRQLEGSDCVPGFGPHWELAHQLYDDNRVIDTEIHQRLTHIRFGPHKASVQLGALAKMLFGEDMSDAKNIPDEAQALLQDAVPYSEWPADLLLRTPWRVKFGYLLERYGDAVDTWPEEAVSYALDDVRLPWQLHRWQQRRWEGREIPDAKAQVQYSWMLHVLAIPGWLADRERAQSIRERYQGVISYCDRTLLTAGILHAPGRKLTTKRRKLQSEIAAALEEVPKPKGIDAAEWAEFDALEQRSKCPTDRKTVLAALARSGTSPVVLADALVQGVEPCLDGHAAPVLAAHLLRAEALSAAKKAAKAGEDPNAYTAVAEAALPVLLKAGLVEASHPRTIKKARLADYVFASLGDAAKMTDTGFALYGDAATPAQRREYCATDTKAVRQAILSAGGTPLNVADAVEQAEDTTDAFDAWLAGSKAPQLNAYAVRTKADKTIGNFLDKLDTPRRVRTTYQTLVDTGRTSCLAGWVPVKTSTGDKPIADVRVGDLVWTHKKRWRRVTATWTKGVQPMHVLSLSNGKLVTCTGAHKVLLSSGQWTTIEELLSECQHALGQRPGKQEKGIGAVPFAEALHHQTDWRDVGHSSAKCLVRYEALPAAGGTQGAQDIEIFGSQAGQQEPSVRQDTRTASAMEGGVLEQSRVLDDPAQRQASNGASRSHGGSIGVGRVAGQSLRSPHRWGHGKQCTGQPSTLHAARAQGYPYLAAEGGQVVAVEKADYCGDFLVYDITVDEDSSYCAQGVFHHNSRAVNIQQFPRDYDKPAHLHVRGCIVPDPGWAFVIADYTQLELCALAHVLTQLVRYYAQHPKRKAYAERLLGREISTNYESTLSRAINNNQDCHVLMASVLRGNGESYEECYALYERADEKKGAKQPLDVDEKQIIDDRQLAKPCNFGFPGGLGEAKFIDYAAGYGVTIDMPTSKRARAAYMATWIEMRLYFDHISRLTRDGTGVLVQFYSKRERGDVFFTQASNGFFQGLAADGAKYAGKLLVHNAYRVPESPLFGCRPSGFVHDEYLVNAPIDKAEAALPEVERLMVTGMQRWIPDVKIKAPGKVLYERWGK